MSKVISFSISDRYLDKLRSLYPSLTDNLAVKQFVTDGLDGSLGNSLDDTLDGDLDGKLKTLIESSLDGLLEGRLDATVGKLLTSLSERMARLEERLDTNLDGGLDEMELLLRMQREASITSLIPTGETSPFPTNQETVETDSTIELDKGAIGPVPGDSDSIEPGKGEGMTAVDADKYLKTKKVKVSDDSLYRWIRQEKIPDSPQGKKVQKYLRLINQLYYPIN